MATQMADEIMPSSENTPGSPTSSTGQIPLEQPPKLKGRKKFLQNLQRMSSSPTLTRRGRSASTGYRRDHKASLSCVSLSSTAYSPCLGNESSSQLYGGLNPRPATPGYAGPSGDAQGINNRIRLVGTDSPNTSQPRTIPLPFDVRPASRGSPRSLTPDGAKEEAEIERETAPPEPRLVRELDFWGELPQELKVEVFRYLDPREIVRCSAVSKAWNAMCFDGQLWTKVDTTEFYQRIPGDILVKLITSGGPFVRDLNLRGCAQMRDKWSSEGERISDLCRNVVNFSLEGCRIDRISMHHFLTRNPRLRYINISGLNSVTNHAMKVIAQSCPELESFNISFCKHVKTTALLQVVQACQQLKDLRASEIQGFDDEDFMLALYERNTLDRLVMSRTDLNDESLKVLMHGVNPTIDLLTDRPTVPPRRFRHLDVHHCHDLTDSGLKSLAHNVPDLEGLQVSQCPELTDDSVIEVIRTTPKLSHLELEDLENLTNLTLTELAKSAPKLEHLNISYCESLGDTGMLQVMKSCPKLRSVEMDNTRVSDLTLMEASYRVRRRGYGEEIPKVGLRLVVFDCANVTWAGVREVLSSNAYLPRVRKPVSAVVTVTQTSEDDSSPTTTAFVTPSSTPPPVATYPSEIIQLKCFYGWQMTVDEHTKRVKRGDLAAASRLDRKWTDYMMATEEAGAAGAGARRRRRRAREAERLYNADDSEEESYGIGLSALGGTRRRRAQSGSSCTVM